MKCIHVVAGILFDDEGRILLAERVGDPPFAGLWEFPGGKVLDGEPSGTALMRELREELGIDVGSFEHLASVRHDYDDRCVSLDFYIVTDWSGEPKGLDDQQLRWEFATALQAEELLPADAPVLAMLQPRTANRY
jgi:8-oxo-dGTP diphosphatase